MQFARRYYNGAVRELNTRIESVPNNLLAHWFNFEIREYFQKSSDDAASVPLVELGGHGMIRVLPAVALLLPLIASADERILEFQSDIRIAQAGWIEVTETITVRSEGQQIRRGIYRDFPDHL